MVPISGPRMAFGFGEACSRFVTRLGSCLRLTASTVVSILVVILRPFNDLEDLKELVLPISCRGFIAATTAGSEGLRAGTGLRAVDAGFGWLCRG